MRSFSSAVVTALALLASGVAAAPTAEPLVNIKRALGEKNAGSYIVKLKNNVAQQKAIDFVNDKIAMFRSTDSITHQWDKSILNGFAGKFSEQVLNELRASPDVEYIEEDGIMHAFATVTQTNAPWGLQRISQNGRVTSGSATSLDHTYRYDSAGGSGVDIYIVDTGISTTHTSFGGRARFGAAFPSSDTTDGNGHGTHCAGTAASAGYGVAKAASLIAVKVLTDAGSGAVSDIVSGLNYVGTQARASGRPSVASMSLGGSASTALDNAVTNLVNQGVHVAVAAGNSNTDAGSTSPARTRGAVTVGASDFNDARASFSNFGSVVDIFAPGVSVTSTWIGSNTATNTISGTSMATPHVAGLIAYLISRRGNQSPAAMTTLLQSLGVDNAISGIPSGTRNDLARNDI